MKRKKTMNKHIYSIMNDFFFVNRHAQIIDFSFWMMYHNCTPLFFTFNKEQKENVYG